MEAFEESCIKKCLIAISSLWIYGIVHKAGDQPCFSQKILLTWPSKLLANNYIGEPAETSGSVEGQINWTDENGQQDHPLAWCLPPMSHNPPALPFVAFLLNSYFSFPGMTPRIWSSKAFPRFLCVPSTLATHFLPGLWCSPRDCWQEPCHQLCWGG